MPKQSTQNRTLLKKVAAAHAEKILTRRNLSRKLRAEALRRYSKRVAIETKFTRSPSRKKGLGNSTNVIASKGLQTAGYLLAIGDSWFDYPIHDVLTKLEDHYGYNVESSAHKGDPIESMVSSVGQLDKFSRCMDKVVALGVVPKAILISGGGDDIAGNEFGMLINDKDLSPIAGWNEQVVAGVIDTRIADAYRLMVYSINSICTKDQRRTFPILVHGYDYPVPDGRGFLGGWGPLPGPWLKPGFDEKLFTDLKATTTMIAALIDRFNAMLKSLLKEPGFENVHYVDLRNTLSNKPSDYKDWWANELHPTGGSLWDAKDGFLAVASQFQKVLAALK